MHDAIKYHPGHMLQCFKAFSVDRFWLAILFAVSIFWGHFPTDSCQLFNYCTVAQWLVGGWLVRWLVGWLLSQHLKNFNYHLIIKNACAYRINPNASIVPFLARIRLLAPLIAYQCSISRARISSRTANRLAGSCLPVSSSSECHWQQQRRC